MERDQALKFMHDLLRLMVQKKGSDLFITANFPPAIKIDGKTTPVIQWNEFWLYPAAGAAVVLVLFAVSFFDRQQPSKSGARPA